MHTNINFVISSTQIVEWNSWGGVKIIKKLKHFGEVVEPAILVPTTIINHMYEL